MIGFIFGLIFGFCIFVLDEIKKLLDCITNLQEENKDLKEQVDYQNIWREEYSNRIDKAIGYITEDDVFYYGDELYDSYQEIVNILKGDIDE